MEGLRAGGEQWMPATGQHAEQGPNHGTKLCKWAWEHVHLVNMNRAPKDPQGVLLMVGVAETPEGPERNTSGHADLFLHNK